MLNMWKCAGNSVLYGGSRSESGIGSGIELGRSQGRKVLNRTRLNIDRSIARWENRKKDKKMGRVRVGDKTRSVYLVRRNKIRM